MLTGVVLSLVLALLSACAGPQLRVPRASPQTVDIERQRQLGLIQDKQDVEFRSRIEEWRRVFAVYSRLRTSATDLCKTDVKPFWGMWLADQSLFPAIDQARAKRFLGIDQNLSLLAVSEPAASAGLQPGDILTKIDAVNLQSQSRLPQVSSLQRAGEALAKANMRSVEIEISRANEKYSVVLSPVVGCRYSLKILPDALINAAATGDEILLFSGVLAIANNDDELAHVISHELAHNALGHPGRSESNQSVGAAIGVIVDIGILLGTRINTQGGFSQLGADAGRKAYSQEFEREADYMSLYFMTRSGFDPTKAADVQRKFGVVTPGSIYNTYAATHPSTAERAANLDVALNEVAGKIARNEPLVPTELHGLPSQDTVAVAYASKVSEREKSAQPKVATLQPVVRDVTPKTIRHHAILTQTTGRLMSIPPMTLDADYFDNGSGAGTSRLIFPGNRILDGEFKLLPLQESFKGFFKPRLIDPDKFVPSTNSAQKGFAIYSDQGGTSVECSFSMSDTGRIDQGRCLDNRGNEYSITK